MDPCIDIDSLIKSLSEKLAPLKEQYPVLLHIDTSGVSMQKVTISLQRYCSVAGCSRNFLFFCKIPGSFRTGGAVVSSVNPWLFE